MPSSGKLEADDDDERKKIAIAVTNALNTVTSILNVSRNYLIRNLVNRSS